MLYNKREKKLKKKDKFEVKLRVTPANYVPRIRDFHSLRLELFRYSLS